jgi:hypothetical protein
MQYNPPYGVSDPDAPYINGNPSTGTMGSIPPAASIEYPQREIVNFINSSDLAPDNGDLTQLAKGVQSGTVSYGVDTGSANVLSAQLSPVPDQYAPGMMVRILVAQDNTGPSSLALNALGAANILENGATLVGGELLKNSVRLFIYNVGHYWELIRGGGGGEGGGGSGPGPVGGYAATRTLYIYNSMTVTTTANEIAAEVRLWAGGGGGGGANSGGLAAGGGGGEYAEGFFGVAPNTAYGATVGAGGVGGAGTAGQAGGLSNFGGLITCGGGQGGYYMVGNGIVTTNVPGGSGGVGGGFRVPGGYSGIAMPFSTSILEAQGGFSYAGGMSPLVYCGIGTADPGNTGVYPGGGGGGAYYNANGGAGAHGFMIVTLYAGV